MFFGFRVFRFVVFFWVCGFDGFGFSGFRGFGGLGFQGLLVGSGKNIPGIRVHMMHIRDYLMSS